MTGNDGRIFCSFYPIIQKELLFMCFNQSELNDMLPSKQTVNRLINQLTSDRQPDSLGLEQIT